MLRRFLYNTLLAIPLLLALGWLTLLQSTPAGMTQLSPGRTEALITGLVIFIIGYIIFLGLIYSEEIKGVLHKVRL